LILSTVKEFFRVPTPYKYFFPKISTIILLLNAKKRKMGAPSEIAKRAL